MAETNNISAPDATLRQWAELAERSPADLRREISSATMDQLTQLADTFDVLKKSPTDEAKKVIQERLDQLKQQYTVDKYLEEIGKRFKLARLLGLQEKKVPQTDSFERNLYYTLSLPAKWGNQLASLGFTGFSAIALNYLGGYGERKCGEIEIADAIQENKIVGEIITFNGINSAEWSDWKEVVTQKLASTNRAERKMRSLKAITKEFIELTRQEQNLDGASRPDIMVTMESLLDIETLRKRVEDKRAKQTTNDKETKLAEDWKPADVASVKAGTPPSAKKEKGHWTVTTPDSALDRTLQTAVISLNGAESITIVSASEAGELDMEKKQVLVPVGTLPADLDRMNRVLAEGSVNRLSKIIFAPAKAMPTTNPLQAEYYKGTLTLAANDQRFEAALKLRGLEPILASAGDNEKLEFVNGSTWQKKADTFPARPAPATPPPAV
jgi:DNA-binding transcriptional regulator YdaS (Cro superfamily)